MKKPGLFAYFSKYAWSDEDWASEALTFLLQGCTEAREALHDYVERLFGIAIDPGLRYEWQATGPAKDRPDVVGSVPAGEQLIIEAKFWARLTENQPGAYLRRLQPGMPGVVLFIAPQERLLILWPQLLANLAAYTGEPVPSAVHEPGRYELVRPSGHVLALRSWREVLDELDNHLREAGLNDWLADLAQLRGLTERMDQPGFLPLRSEDLDTRTARQVRSLFPLVRRLAGEFGESDPLQKGHDKHSNDPPYFGWWLKSKACGIDIWVGLYFDAWATYGCSPLWAAVYADANWTMPKLELALSQVRLSAGAGPWQDEVDAAYIVPLTLKPSAVEDDVVADLKAQLCAIVEVLDRVAATDGARQVQGPAESAKDLSAAQQVPLSD